MAKISKKRQIVLREDEFQVRNLYAHACQRWPKDVVDKDLTRLWDLRCIWGVQRVLPFGNTNFTNLGEMLWVAKEVCEFGSVEIKTPNP